MKRFSVLILLFLATNCSKKTDTDERCLRSLDNKGISSKMMSDGRVWMTENLRIDMPESYCQQDDTLLCRRYGRLYTWEAAKNGCSNLGNGWRLPTNEEWQTLARYYGGIMSDSEDKGRSAYFNLLEGGSAEFNALLGGNREANGSYERLEAHGFYWTATEYDSAEAWFYNFGKGSTLINRHTGDKKLAVSVRCIKEIAL
ncbi:FISUMP domain-containing protein [Negadavirga shengliensis]|uniref:FISUMP domain-containing protein n=1 Tax=Negadavirga shengliensis TaxID=1389218 RepID=A0ABV9SWS5_9BACT